MNIIKMVVAALLMVVSFAGYGQTVVNAGIGWNLFGNSSSTPMTVTPALFPASAVQTVWKWNKLNASWQFYSPTVADGGQAYATSKGYGFLTTVNAGEGFWVNATSPFLFQLIGGVTTASAASSLVTGWNLLAIGDNKTPREFNSALSPASPEAIPTTNMVTLWAWDNPSSRWYFYAPTLDLAGTLYDQTLAKGYLDFGANTLAPGTGFWVNSLITGGGVLHYTDKVYAIWTGSYPFAVTKTGVTKVTNKTQYTVGVLPLYNCWLADKPLANGWVLTNCQDAVSAGRHVLYVDPSKEEMYEYTGTVPTDLVWRAVEERLDRPEWAARAQVSDGWYFTPWDNRSILNFQTNTGTITTIKAGTFAVDGDMRVMVSYTN